MDTSDFYVTKYSVKYEQKWINHLNNIDLKTNACNTHGSVPISEVSNIENYKNPAKNSNITILPKDNFKPLSKCGVIPVMSLTYSDSSTSPCNRPWRYVSTVSLTSALDGGRWSTPLPGRFPPPPGKRTGIHYTGRWLGPRTGLDGCKKISSPPGFDPRTVQSVASHLYWQCTL